MTYKQLACLLVKRRRDIFFRPRAVLVKLAFVTVSYDFLESLAPPPREQAMFVL